MKKLIIFIHLLLLTVSLATAQTEKLPSLTIECAEAGTLNELNLPEETYGFDHVFLKGSFNADDLNVIQRTMIHKNIRVLNCKDANFLKSGSESTWENAIGIIEDGTYPRNFISAHTIVMPKSLKKIIPWQGTSSVRLILPEGIERIEQYAYEWGGIDSLINMPQSLQYIGAGAFYSCFTLKTLKMPDNIKIIEDTCLNVLNKLHLPANLEEISWRGVYFGGKSITFPSTLRRIGPCGFEARRYNEGVSYLKEIHVLATEPPYCDPNFSPGELNGLTEGELYMKSKGNCLDGMDKSTCILYVPKGCVEKYRAAREWGDFAIIREESDDYREDMTGFEEWENVEEEYSDQASLVDIVAGQLLGTPKYYDIKGFEHESPVKGVNIIVYPGMKAKKEIIR